MTTVDFPRMAFGWRTLTTAPAVTASVSHTTAAALKAALADADALNVDQNYSLTLLELGVTDDETTETA